MEKEGQDWVLWDLLDMISVASGNRAHSSEYMASKSSCASATCCQESHPSENSSDTCRGHTDTALCFHFLVYTKAWQVSSIFLLDFA